MTLSSASCSTASSSSSSSTYLGPRHPTLVSRLSSNSNSSGNTATTYNNNNNNKSHNSNNSRSTSTSRTSTSKTHWTMATFSKRHPMIEIGSLDSFSLDENLRRGIPEAPVKPPDFYFEPPRSTKSHFLLVSSAEDERPDPDQVFAITLLHLIVPFNVLNNIEKL